MMGSLRAVKRNTSPKMGALLAVVVAVEIDLVDVENLAQEDGNDLQMEWVIVLLLLLLVSRVNPLAVRLCNCLWRRHIIIMTVW